MLKRLIAVAVLLGGSALAAGPDHPAIIELVDGRMLRPIDTLEFALDPKPYVGKQIKVSRCQVSQARVGGALCSYRYGARNQQASIHLMSHEMSRDDLQRMVKNCPGFHDVPECRVVVTGTLDDRILLEMKNMQIEWPSAGH